MIIFSGVNEESSRVLNNSSTGVEKTCLLPITAICN